jgi:hypothetical protein
MGYRRKYLLPNYISQYVEMTRLRAEISHYRQQLRQLASDDGSVRTMMALSTRQCSR